MTPLQRILSGFMSLVVCCAVAFVALITVVLPLWAIIESSWLRFRTRNRRLP